MSMIGPESAIQMAVIDLMLGVVRAVVFVYDVLTYPVYTFIQQPWEAKTRQNLGVVHQTERNAEAIAFRRDKGASEIYQEIIVRNGVDTVSKAFNYSVKKFGQKECLGIREVHGIEDEVQQNGKRYWMKRGRGTPICDKIVFNKIRSLLGGKMDFVLVGGAPLCEKTHDFIRTCLGVTVVQGYSLTESGCTGTVMESRDLSTGTVGRPMTGLEVKLINWEEGNYNVSDTPRPRGEICLSGTPVAKGYFKVDSNTKDSFFVDNQGKRWFKTGDVGEFDSQGQLRIIDRKKDLVKLQLGEYVSLGKVEAQLKTHPLVENICVYGDPYKQTTVALVVPSKVHLEALGQRLGKTESFEQLCTDSDVLEAVLKDLSTTGLSQGLEKFEIPSALTLCPDPWTPESGLITAAFKLKRKVVQRQFQDRINQMYSQKRPSSP
eukprot:TCALIF_08850-PA protein Name:"Similar to ACSL3 Long-chain-fatty-acid--CoA ligase 3 (Homo sapiens)" AED:0.14 eAED:0.14 QI:0/0/0/0.85/1/1/7/0/432